MRKVGIKQFQKNIYKETKDLPIVVTKNGEPIFDIVPHANTSVNTKDNATTPKKRDYSFITARGGMPEDVINPELTEVASVNLDAIQFPSASQINNEWLIKKRPAGKCQAPGVVCKGVGQKYRITFPDTEGEVKREVFLCDLHVKKAQEQDMEVEEA